MIVIEDQSSVKEERFPVGMRVLAVDDDPICLKVLDTLLKKCHYHVTTTNQSVQALKMLRENRNKYDLVISDVNMPDMDGFKLLELVGLEMDLPVIMLSAHSDKDLVYKGVTHGAVDYLLKPVRIEELKNIWQHVIRRKKLHPNNPDKPREGGGQGVATADDQNGKGNRKRKDQDEDEEEYRDDDLNENDEPGSQKKPRVVWSVDLHRKFVVAVNQLGLDKAVPKKILDLMNVEGLTRENVASHLQKYRLYLKRLSSVVSSQQKDSSYLTMASLDGFGDFRALRGPGRLANTQGSMLGRLNSPSGLTLRGIASSGLLQPQNTSISVNSPMKIQPALFQAKSNNNRIGEFNHNSSVTGPSSHTPITLHQNQSKGALGIQSSLGVASLNQERFNNWSPTNSMAMRENIQIGNNTAYDSLVTFPVESTGLVDNTNYNPQQRWAESFNTMSSLGSVDACVFQQGDDVDNSVMQPRTKSNVDYLLEQTKSQNDNYDSLDDIVNAIKRDQNGTILMDGEFEYDGFSLGSCF